MPEGGELTPELKKLTKSTQRKRVPKKRGTEEDPQTRPATDNQPVEPEASKRNSLEPPIKDDAEPREPKKRGRPKKKV